MTQEIEAVLTGGREPRGGGGIYGWADGQVAAAMAIAKQTPEVWDALPDWRKNRADNLMRTLAVAAHWTLDDDIGFYEYMHLLDDDYVMRQSWSPNHWLGQTAVMVSAAVYFDGYAGKAGGRYLDEHVFGTNFNRDHYLNLFDIYGWTNLKDTWRISTADMNAGMQRRGDHFFKIEDPSGDTVGYVRGLDDPLLYLESVIEYRGFSGTVRDTFTVTTANPDFQASALSGSSPYVGQTGALTELSRDDRSSVRYSFDMWRNLIPMRTVLEVADMWNSPNHNVDAKLDQLYRVGSEDLLYKMHHGYRGYSNGSEVKHYDLRGSLGYDTFRRVWRNFLAPDLAPNRNAWERIEAESFDQTGKGQYDTSIDVNNNHNGQNVSNLSGASGRIIGYIRDGEYVIYDRVNFGAIGQNRMELRYATPVAGRTVQVEVREGSGWTDLGTLSVSPTGPWGSYQPLTRDLAAMVSGEKRLRLTFNGSLNLDWVRFKRIDAGNTPTPTSSATGPMIADRSVIQAEDFDAGLPGMAYHDTTAGSFGGDAYRSNTDVDIVAKSNAQNGYVVGWTSDGEWLDYTVQLTPGVYNITLRYSSGTHRPGDVRLALSGHTLGTFTDLQSTGGWNRFDTTTLMSVAVSPQVNPVLRLSVIGDGFDLDSLYFELESST
ncbi:MAG: carbohydrate-binding protein [Planctomycetota bacterium]